jgi:hypothetical protein
MLLTQCAVPINRRVMMDFNARSNPLLGAFQLAAQAYGTQMQAWSRSAAPMMRAAMQWNTEAVAFANRRTQACLVAPQRLAICRTPQDAVQETMLFWQTAARDWLETSQRMAAPLRSAIANVRVPAGRADMPAPRDYITFPEPKDVREPLPGAPWTGRAEKDKRDAA